MISAAMGRYLLFVITLYHINTTAIVKCYILLFEADGLH